MVAIPYIESPFFKEHFPSTTDPQLLQVAQSLHTDGYAIIEFPDSAFEARVEVIQQHLKDRYNWQAWRDGKREGLRIQDAWVFDADVKAIATNAVIIDLLTKLYGRQAFPFQTLNFPVGTEQHFHSDSAYFSSIPERFMCGVWVAFEDVQPESGPLLYYPGSHKLPLYTNEHIGLTPPADTDETYDYDSYHEFWEKLVAAYGLQPQTFLPKKGQALIWAANLLHGGAPQRDKRLTRWSQVTHYYFRDCGYYLPIGSLPLLGTIDYRSTVDITTGQRVPQSINGTTLTTEARQRVGRQFESVRPFTPPDFDDELYLFLHPDVAAAELEPRKHYLEYGFAERRGYKLT